LEVYRERKNIDLTLVFPNGNSLIIENKVKSIPSREQLKEYGDNVKDRAGTSFLLLSLTRPSFAIPAQSAFDIDGIRWHLLTYSSLADRLELLKKQNTAINEYHGLILSDYLDFIRNLAAIAEHLSLEDDMAEFFMPNERALLSKIRLYDLMDKMRYGQLAQRLGDAIAADGLRLVPKEQFWQEEAGAWMIDSALYRGEALCEFMYMVVGGNLPVTLGVMLQADAVKVNIHVSPTKVAGDASKILAKRISEQLFNPASGERVWFDLSRVPGNSKEMPVSGFNQYSGNVFYRYKRLHRCSSVRDVLSLFMSYVETIRTSEDNIRAHVALAIKSVL